MKCLKCKVELVDGSKYCHKCGTIALKKLAFISNGKNKKSVENILIEALKEVQKELVTIRDRVQVIEEKNNEVLIPSTIGNFPLPSPGPGITTTPMNEDFYVWTGNGTGNGNFIIDNSIGDGSIESNTTNLFFSTESNSSSFLDTELRIEN